MGGVTYDTLLLVCLISIPVLSIARVVVEVIREHRHPTTEHTER